MSILVECWLGGGERERKEGIFLVNIDSSTDGVVSMEFFPHSTSDDDDRLENCWMKEKKKQKFIKEFFEISSLEWKSYKNSHATRTHHHQAPIKNVWMYLHEKGDYRRDFLAEITRFSISIMRIAYNCSFLINSHHSIVLFVIIDKWKFLLFFLWRHQSQKHLLKVKRRKQIFIIPIKIHFIPLFLILLFLWDRRDALNNLMLLMMIGVGSDNSYKLCMWEGMKK